MYVSPEDRAKRLAEIAKKVQKGETQTIIVRELLSLFNAYRRGYWVVARIRKALADLGLETSPDFDSVHIDSIVLFTTAKPDEKVDDETDTSVFADPTYRIIRLDAANNAPLRVAPDATLEEAATLMLAHDYSQLPVMTSDREVKGVISWASIGSRLAFEKGGTVVRELMDEVHEIRADASLFSAIQTISVHGYVLVRGEENRITGIVTASDLSLQFHQLAEPFLLLGEIENHVRRIIEAHFSVEELEAAKDPADEDRKVESVADLNFGEYLRLLEDPKNWAKLATRIHRSTFVKKLDEVRCIRNDVMHFDPDPIGDKQLNALRDFAKLLLRLQTLGVT